MHPSQLDGQPLPEADLGPAAGPQCAACLWDRHAAAHLAEVIEYWPRRQDAKRVGLAGRMAPMAENEIARIIVDSAYKIHTQ